MPMAVCRTRKNRPHLYELKRVRRWVFQHFQPVTGQAGLRCAIASEKICLGTTTDGLEFHGAMDMSVWGSLW
jgi:hypothetical protein